MKTFSAFTGLVLCVSVTGHAPAQNLFVANNGAANNILEITPGGAQSTFASGLGGPAGLAFNSTGNLFVANAITGNITEITPGGAQSTFASGLNVPYGLAFNSAGDLFVANGAANNIIVITPGGLRATFASGLVDPAGLAFNNAGDLFEADMHSGNIYEFTPGGAQSTFASGLANPWGLAFNSAGNLFVADEDNGVLGGGGITEITPGGVQSTFASGLSAPNELAFNGAGNLFVAEGAADDILEFTPDGTQSTFASGLDNPVGLAFQPAPEPSVLGLLAVAATALLVCRRRNNSPIAIIGLCVAFTGHGLAQTNHVSTNATIKAAAQKPKPFVMPDEITTLSGRTYDGVKLQSATANEIYIVYSDNEGVMQADNIKLADLPPDLQKHFNFNQKKAALADAKEREEEAKLVSSSGMTPSQNLLLQQHA